MALLAKGAQAHCNNRVHINRDGQSTCHSSPQLTPLLSPLSIPPLRLYCSYSPLLSPLLCSSSSPSHPPHLLLPFLSSTPPSSAPSPSLHSSSPLLPSFAPSLLSSPPRPHPLPHPSPTLPLDTGPSSFHRETCKGGQIF